MATLKLAEVVIDAVIAKLQAGMPARVAAVNAEKADDVTIAAPSNDRYYVGGTDILTQTDPAVIVTELPAAGDWEWEGPDQLTVELLILVAVFDLDSDRERLARKLMRQARCAAEAVWDDSPRGALTGGVAFHIRPVRVSPGPVFDPQEQRSMFTQLYGVVFEARRIEG